MEEDVIEPEELTLEDGEVLVKLAREAVEKSFVNESISIENVPQKLKRRGTAFVTIERFFEGKRILRGCIGFIEPIAPLAKVVVEAALAAAFEDPRFPPLRPSELPLVVFEVSVLSRFKPLPKNPEERLSSIRIGETGLMVRKGIFSGLLLPQVAVEYKWGPREFLENTCMKAGLPPNCWEDEKAEFYYFTARIFEEETPNGAVVERKLT